MHVSAFMSLYRDLTTQTEYGLQEDCIMLCAEKKGKEKNDKPSKIYLSLEQEVQLLAPSTTLLYNRGFPYF